MNSQTNQIIFTQGDSPVLSLTAVDGDGNPINLTGATFSTQIKGPNGIVVTFPNSQHTANPDQMDFPGMFTLSLSTSDTMSCGIGSNKEILTQITQSSSVIYFHGQGILQVLPAVPLQ